MPRAIRLTRDLVVFILGMFGFITQMVIVASGGHSDPTFLYGSLAALGVAAFLRGISITPTLSEPAQPKDGTRNRATV